MILEKRVMLRSRIGREMKDIIGLMFTNQRSHLFAVRHIADDPATTSVRSRNADDVDTLLAKQVAQVETVLSIDSKNKGVHKVTTESDISFKISFSQKDLNSRLFRIKGVELVPE